MKISNGITIEDFQNGIEKKRISADACLTAQDKFKKYLDYFRIQHRD